jgi:hypothetical protein
MIEDNFYLIGRALFKDYPKYFSQLASLIEQTESKALSDVNPLPALYDSFCTMVGTSACPVKED